MMYAMDLKPGDVFQDADDTANIWFQVITCQRIEHQIFKLDTINLDSNTTTVHYVSGTHTVNVQENTKQARTP